MSGSRTHAARGLAAVLLTASVIAGLATGCGGSAGDPDTPGAVVSVEQALASKDGTSLRVQGHIVATESAVVLADALLESYPPQAGGAVLPVTGLDLSALVALLSTAAQPDLAQVSWTDYWVTLGGVIKAGVLEVEAVPPVVESSTAEAKVRFSLPVDALVSGEVAWWVFDVSNLTTTALDLTFASGQMCEVVLSQGGVEKYRWSKGKAFTQAVMTDTIEPGDTTPVVFNDIIEVPPGDYDLTASVTASVGNAGGGTALPQLVAKVTVR